jgi:hypothetical protein
MSDNSNPPLSDPTNTDELDEILNIDEIVAYLAENNDLHPFKAKIARLIALKQREELEAFRNSEGEIVFLTEQGLRYTNSQIARLNTIIGSEK